VFSGKAAVSLTGKLKKNFNIFIISGGFRKERRPSRGGPERVSIKDWGGIE